MKKTVRIALATLSTKVGDKETNIQKALNTIDDAIENGAELIGFGECYTSGYSGEDIIKELAEPIPGETTDIFHKKAREHECYIIVGLPERKRNKFYNTAALIGPNGVIGTYQKTFLGSGDVKQFAQGRNYPVWDTALGKIGIMICYDAFFPEAARILALKGAELIVCPAASCISQRDFNKYIPARAAENTVYVAFVNLAGYRAELQNYYFGGSFLVDPNGEPVVGPVGFHEHTVFGVIRDQTLTEIRAKRHQLLDLRQQGVAGIQDQYIPFNGCTDPKL